MLASEAPPQVVMSGQVVVSPSKTKTARDDCLKIMDPSRKKLVSLETQRIAGILEACIQKVEMISLLPAVMTNKGLSHVAADDGLRTMMENHIEVSDRYEYLRALTAKPENQTPSTLKGKADAADSVHCSIQHLFRRNQACPLVNRTLGFLMGMLEAGSHEESTGALAKGLVELRSVLLERLLTTPMEEKERMCRMQETSQRYHSNLELVSSLEAEVAASIKDKDDAIFEKNLTIRRLKNSLHQMEKISEDFVSRTRQDAEKQNQAEQNASFGRQQRMNQEVNLLKAQLISLITDNRDVEMTMRKKKYKVETEIENWIQKYDADMGEKQVELEELERVFEEEKEELRELEEHYSVLEEEYLQVMEEQRLALERQEEEERAQEVMGRAAIVIQAHWRGYCVRKAMKAKAKAKGGKKGKGGKGKKK
ncbi:dynein regulatory complex protein 10 [Engraulis encrasicolus]|uniref:dynein regulatory complex protein 10 n=1 Tax=Engraulis encrasicolus TaxID=184585 RepID=UPI002FD61855